MQRDKDLQSNMEDVEGEMDIEAMRSLNRRCRGRDGY
jgi:hypothetical protein